MLAFTTSEIPFATDYTPAPGRHIESCARQWRCPTDVEYQPLTCGEAAAPCRHGDRPAATAAEAYAAAVIKPPVPPHLARGRCRAGRTIACWPTCSRTQCSGRPAVLGRGGRHPSPIGNWLCRNIRRVVLLYRNHHADGWSPSETGARILPRGYRRRLRQHQAD